MGGQDDAVTDNATDVTQLRHEVFAMYADIAYHKDTGEFLPEGRTRDLCRPLRSSGSIRCRGRPGQIHWHESADLHCRLSAWGRQGLAVGIP